MNDPTETPEHRPFSARANRAVLGAALVVLLAFAFADSAIAAAGDLAPAFSGDGKLTTDFGANGIDAAQGTAVQADGKIVVVGNVNAGSTGGSFGLARYSPDGSLDPSFSGDGLQATDLDGAGGGAIAVAIQADGKIVVVGTTPTSGPTGADFALARFNPNGSLDPSFSGDGFTLTDFSGDHDIASAVAIGADDKIVVAGQTFQPGPGVQVDFGVVRYNANGTLDGSFSGDGKQTTDFAGGSDRGRGVVIQPDGRIVVAGEVVAGGTNFGLARYDVNGSLDTTFAGDGTQEASIGGSFAIANAVALQPDGRFVVAGYAFDPATHRDFAVARYAADGSLDTTFAGDGSLTTDFAGPGSNNEDEGNGLALQDDGKIVVAGAADEFDTASGLSGGKFAVARYGADGAPDLTFSGDGRTREPLAVTSRANAVAIQPDGGIVLAGDLGTPQFAAGPFDFAVACFQGDSGPGCGVDSSGGGGSGGSGGGGSSSGGGGGGGSSLDLYLPTPVPTGDADTEVTDPDVTIGKKLTVKGNELKVKPSAGAQEMVTVEGKGSAVIQSAKKGGKGKGGKKRRAKGVKQTELKAVTKTVEAGERTILRLKYKGSKKKRQKLTKKLIKSIKQGKKATVRIQVTFTDVVGNTATEKRVSRLKVKGKKGGKRK